MSTGADPAREPRPTTLGGWGGAAGDPPGKRRGGIASLRLQPPARVRPMEKIGKKVSFDVNATGFPPMAYNETAKLFFPFFPRSEKITEKISSTQLIAGQWLAASANLFFPGAEKINSTQVQSVT